MTLFLTLFPGKNKPVSGKSTVNLRQFSPKTHYFSSYLHNLPHPKYFSTIQTILIPRIGSRKQRKKGSCAKKGVQKHFSTIGSIHADHCAGFLRDLIHSVLFHKYALQRGKVCGNSAGFGYFTQHYPKKHGALLRFFIDIPNAQKNHALHKIRALWNFAP